MLGTKRDLIEADEKDAWEFPKIFDYQRLDSRVRSLHSDLEQKLDRKLVFEDGAHNQDASFSWAIRLSEVECERFIQVCDLRISNFGNLAAVTDEDYEQTEECQAVFKVVSAHGFTPVSHSLLDSEYDGLNGDSFSDWWLRYFDWL